MAHNKTLAAQLYGEFRDFFPENRVEYFVSYYDYYQPESYIPSKDQYIEKDAYINPKIEQMRLAATASLSSRKDVIVVASVSCIYGLGNPENFQSMGFELKVGEKISRRGMLTKLIDILYERNDIELAPGRFRVKGDTIDLIPGYFNDIIRIELFGDEVDRISEIDRITGKRKEALDYFYVYPARHYVIPEEDKKSAIQSILAELEERLPQLGMIEAHRLKQRTLHDMEMIEETGSCKGIENYSRHFDGRQPGQQPYCLLDYFPKDFLLVIDESHQTLPQIHGMYKGDMSRKKSLVDYGFRLPSAYDNRPLRFEEFERYMKNVIFVSATPGAYELAHSGPPVQQIIRPTGLLDPEVEVRPIEGQVRDAMMEIEKVVQRKERALVTTLTKRLAEELTDYLSSHGIKARYANPTGAHQTFSTAGRIDASNPFFQDLGTNGRTCFTCHRPESGWTMTPAGIRERFEASAGRDPIFRTNDGSNSPDADVTSVEARRIAYGMLLTKGLIRVGIGIPPDAEFTLESVDDPYGFASSHELSLFRRPPPSANLKFLSTVMWDGRETFPGQTIDFDLLDQSNGATTGHAQGIPLSTQQRREIVDFETGLFTAQVYDVAAGDLGTQGAKGGPRNLSKQEFYIGINDPLGLNPTGTPFSPVVFTNFAAWARPRSSHGGDDDGEDEGRTAARLAVARGEDLFNGKRINITGVKGLNDDLGIAVIPGTCTTCHDSPNVGNHSVAAPLDIGLTDASRRTPDMPLYTLRNKATGQTIQTTDPGRALITGKWRHIGRFKGPILRALAARAPYFHNGSAATLTDVVRFYDERFGIGFTEQEISDLVAFLRVQ